MQLSVKKYITPILTVVGNEAAMKTAIEYLGDLYQKVVI